MIKVKQKNRNGRHLTWSEMKGDRENVLIQTQTTVIEVEYVEPEKREFGFILYGQNTPEQHFNQ